MSAERFEDLTGRFLAGALEDEDDRLLAGMVEADPELAERFLEQLRIEGMLAGLHEARIGDAAFAAAVARGVHLLKNKHETRRFAEGVVKLVREAPKRRAGRVARARSRAQKGLPAWIFGMAAAAAVLIAFVWFLRDPGTPPQVTVESPALGELTALEGVSAHWMTPGGTPRPAKIGEHVRPGEILAVASSELFAAGTAELRLPDGSTLRAHPSTRLRIEAEAGGARPVLEDGRLDARIRPQQAGARLVVATAAGPEVVVVGTAFALQADAARQRVAIRVAEGKVLFRHRGETQTVEAGFASVVSGHAPPLKPLAAQPHPARLTGRVLDDETGKPVHGAEVKLVPCARRPGDEDFKDWPKTETDAEGRFTFEETPAGEAVVQAKIDSSGPVLKSLAERRRVSLPPGQTAEVELRVHRLTLIAGVVVDTAKKALTDYEVHLLPKGGDGLTAPVQFTVSHPNHEFRAVPFQGRSDYQIAVRKRGWVVELPDRRLALPNAPAVALAFMAKLERSATIRGRVLDADSLKPIADAEGAAIYAPRTSRTTLTLTQPDGLKQACVPEPDGSFVFDTNLAAGKYELRAERPGFEPFGFSLDLKAGETREVDMNLTALLRDLP